MTTLHAASVLASALLLFSIEPMVAKAVLPLYGGSPAVWNTCLLFFQGLLLAGYAYAHFGARWLGARGHLIAHALLLLLPLALLPPRVPVEGPAASAWPVPSLLAALAISVGLPFFVLSTNSSMVQRWHAVRAKESPYFLYAASNIGSFVALLAYPFIIEPALGSRAQLRFWSIAYLGFVAITAVALAGAWRHAPAVEERATTKVPVAQRVRWTVRAAVASSLLLAVSMNITTDVASIPLLWVVPLGLYLATFVIAFWPRMLFPRSLLVFLCGIGVSSTIVLPNFGRYGLLVSLGVPLAILFLGCWICHADLARDRPEPEHVTEYYLWIAVGGFAGGLFGNLAAPLIFSSIAEYPLSMALLAILFSVGDDQGAALAASLRTRATWLGIAGIAIAFIVWVAIGRYPNPPEFWDAVPAVTLVLILIFARRPGPFAAACVCAALIAAFGVRPGVRLLDAKRSFFGVARVREIGGKRVLVHGTTTHGAQMVQPFGPEPRAYYAPMSPLARVVRLVPENAHVAVVGLGTGSIAYYAKPGQTLQFYEIDPIIEPLARRWFTFLNHAKAKVGFTLGDARLTLREVPAGSLDLLLVDAFSSDAIPVHLLTVEAIELYFGKLKPDGLLLLHISNRHLHVARVVRAIAKQLGLAAAHVDYYPSEDQSSAVEAAALARSKITLQPLLDRGYTELEPGREVLWTDDRSNLFSLLFAD